MTSHRILLSIAVLALTIVIFSAVANPLRSQAPENAKVYFLAPKDKQTVPAKFTVVFGLKGMGVAPAGTKVHAAGHHHLLIDQPEGLDFDQPLPATDQIIHFGKGQTETDLKLSPGKHCMQLVMGNYVHIPYQPVVSSDVICVNVKPETDLN